jgi:hypothetical protein
MQTGAGVVAIVPMDYVYWSPQLEKLISGAGPHGEIWITGSASKLATDALASVAALSRPRPARGWKNNTLRFTAVRWRRPRVRFPPASI